MGIHRACVLIDRIAKVTPPTRNHPENILPLLCISPRFAHQLASAREFFIGILDRFISNAQVAFDNEA
jgi:hypothetical protein